MTTILGAKSNRGDGAIVLGSDLSVTFTDWKPYGDQYYKQQTKQEGQKIYVDDRKEIALAMSGVFDDKYVSLLHAILNHKIDIKSALDKGFFEELLKIHLIRSDYKAMNPEMMSSLLIATRFDNKPELYGCYPLGKVDRIDDYGAIGSGSEFAKKYVANLTPNIPPHVSLESTIDIVAKSLDHASSDIYTGGLDLVVVTPTDMQCYGSQIKNDLDSAKKNVIEKIKSNYKG